MKTFLFMAALAASALAANAAEAIHKSNRKPADANGAVQYSAIGINSQPKTTGTIVITGQAAEKIYADMSLIQPVGDEKEKAGNGIVCKVAGNTFCTIDFDNVSKGLLEHDCGN